MQAGLPDGFFFGNVCVAERESMNRLFSTAFPTLNQKGNAVDTIETLLWEDDKYKVFWDEARKVAVYRKIFQGGDHGTHVEIPSKDSHSKTP